MDAAACVHKAESRQKAHAFDGQAHVFHSSVHVWPGLGRSAGAGQYSLWLACLHQCIWRGAACACITQSIMRTGRQLQPPQLACHLRHASTGRQDRWYTRPSCTQCSFEWPQAPEYWIKRTSGSASLSVATSRWACTHLVLTSLCGGCSQSAVPRKWVCRDQVRPRLGAVGCSEASSADGQSSDGDHAPGHLDQHQHQPHAHLAGE